MKRAVDAFVANGLSVNSGADGILRLCAGGLPRQCHARVRHVAHVRTRPPRNRRRPVVPVEVRILMHGTPPLVPAYVPTQRPLSLLTVSTLFPNPVQKSHGLFVETQVAQAAWERRSIGAGAGPDSLGAARSLTIPVLGPLFPGAAFPDAGRALCRSPALSRRAQGGYVAYPLHALPYAETVIGAHPALRAIPSI